MRKVLIGLISFVVVLLGFWAYIQWMDTAPIQVPKASELQDELVMPEIDPEMQTIGGTKLITVGQTQYFRYDPVTKEVVAEYGFESLLNPGESSRWRAEKPYLIFYQSDFRCRVDSKRGTFQVETSGSQSVPKDAQLDEEVVIHIIPEPGSGIAETTIHMDDLTFSSERSEFSTDGPVTIQSSQLQLEGYGLVLIFNMGLGKIEYLQIKDLDFLQVSGLAPSSSPLGTKPQEASPGGTEIAAGHEGIQEEETGSPSNLYQCAIRDNVVIQYGNELVVSGADAVDILNVRLASMNETDGRSGGSRGNAGTSDSQRSSAVQGQAAHNVTVRCDGGMIIQPMQLAGIGDGSLDAAMSFEMSGAPLKIDRIREGFGDEFDTLAHCGVLYYKPVEDVLHLFTNPRQPRILLNTDQANSRIETDGNVSWDRKAQRANIGGPGRVYIGNTHNPAAPPSEIAFNGVMDLLFAQMPGDLSSATIRTINFTGGMDAILRQNGTLKTLADTAVFEFAGENQLSEARLDGDVQFESFEAGKTSSTAAAESAVFYFDNNQIASADLKGAVHFVSASGRMDSPNARIEFGPDANGSLHPKMIRTDGDSVLQTLSGTQQPPAKFEARKIDYDMQTGAGLAHGPIQVTFYQTPESNTASDNWVPVTITADENARFLADTDRTIRQVIFNKNVIAARITETPLFTQQDEFHGDRLVVDVGKDAAGSTAISRITFSEGKVFGQSKKWRDEEVLSNVRLTCTEMVFDQSAGRILAAGPGKIELDNSKASAEQAAVSGLSFRRPCVARVRDFQTIEMDLNTLELLVNGREKTMLAEYWPLENGVVVDEILASSVQLKLTFVEDSAGGVLLGSVNTDKGIYFEQKDKYILVGQTLKYDALSDVGWLTITGSEAMPAMVNNARVPAIRYNVNTGQLETSLSTVPGVLSVPNQ